MWFIAILAKRSRAFFVVFEFRCFDDVDILFHVLLLTIFFHEHDFRFLVREIRHDDSNLYQRTIFFVMCQFHHEANNCSLIDNEIDFCNINSFFQLFDFIQKFWHIFVVLDIQRVIFFREFHKLCIVDEFQLFFDFQ